MFPSWRCPTTRKLLANFRCSLFLDKVWTSATGYDKFSRERNYFNLTNGNRSILWAHFVDSRYRIQCYSCAQINEKDSYLFWTKIGGRDIWIKGKKNYETMRWKGKGKRDHEMEILNFKKFITASRNIFIHILHARRRSFISYSLMFP